MIYNPNIYKMASNVRTSILAHFPILLSILIVIGIIGGFTLAFIIHRVDFAIRGLVVAIPCLFSSLVILKVYKSNSNLENLTYFGLLPQKTLSLLFGIVFNISLFFLIISSSRPWYYFVSILFLYVLIFIQIFSTKCSSSFILLEISLTLINLIYGVTLKYPFYFGATDIISHIYISNITYLSGSTIPVDLKNLSIYYAYFPLFHIFIAESSHLLGLDIKTTYFLVTGPIFTISVVFIYYLFDQTINHKTISLISSLIYSILPIVVFSGMYVVTRTMAYIGFIILLYFIYHKNINNSKVAFEICVIIISLFLILVHQVSIFQIVCLLFILYLCERVFITDKYIHNTILLLTIVMSLGYFIYIAYLFSQHLVNIYSNPLNFEALVIKSSVQQGNEWIFLFNNMYMFIFLFFALIGIGYTLWNTHQSYSQVFSLFSFLTLILYIPSPIQTLWQTMILFRFDRFMLLISPFMAFIMGSGIYYFYSFLCQRYPKSIFPKIFILFLFSTFAFMSLNSNSVDPMHSAYNSSREYFTRDELIGYNYIFNYIPYGSTLYADYHTSRFFDSREFYNSSNLRLPFYNSNMIQSIEDLPAYKGYIILRSKEFSDSGLVLGHLINRYFCEYNYENAIHLYSNLSKKNKIYSNSGIDIFCQ